jgi:TetR/AcrR family transcriptional regulator
VPKVKPVPRMKSEDRRRQLLHSAARCFAKDGYRGTTTARIAAEAGVSEPIIYRHFKNKRELFIALIEKVADEVFNNWTQATRKAKTPLEKLQVLLYQNPATSEPWTRAVYQVLFHASTEISDPIIHDAIRDHYERYARALSSVMLEAQEAGQIRSDVPAEWLTWQIIHAAVGFAMIRPLNIPSHSNLEFVRGTIRLLMELLTTGGALESFSAPAEPRGANAGRAGGSAGGKA